MAIPKLLMINTAMMETTMLIASGMAVLAVTMILKDGPDGAQNVNAKVHTLHSFYRPVIAMK